MKSEIEFIKLLTNDLPRSRRQENDVFESDAEILRTSNGFLLFSVDEYSKEDHLRTDNPYKLGWNMTVATISDIFASGGIPAYYSHSVSINPKIWDTDFLKDFTAGISDALHKSNTYFLGGDLGFSDQWHYTGIVLGKSIRKLTRKGAKIGDTVFMTGKSGRGNMDAAYQLFNIQNDNMLPFSLKCKETRLIAKYAACCIDSSDGLVNALLTLSNINNTGFSITNPNMDDIAVKFSKKIGIPAALLLMGECGEYELIFTVENKNVQKFLEEAYSMKLEFTAIGKITPENIKSIKIDNQIIDLFDFNIRGRDFPVEYDYIHSLTEYVKSHGN